MAAQGLCRVLLVVEHQEEHNNLEKEEEEMAGLAVVVVALEDQDPFGMPYIYICNMLLLGLGRRVWIIYREIWDVEISGAFCHQKFKISSRPKRHTDD